MAQRDGGELTVLYWQIRVSRHDTAPNVRSFLVERKCSRAIAQRKRMKPGLEEIRSCRTARPFLLNALPDLAERYDAQEQVCGGHRSEPRHYVRVGTLSKKLGNYIRIEQETHNLSFRGG